MKKFTLLILALASLTACKTSEANYRAAYEKTVAAREAADEGDAYAYDRDSKQSAAQAVIVGSDTIPVVIERVSVVSADGETAPQALAYNVVAGRFKQRFNAFSLRDRLVAAGYKDAFVVQNAEPYYFIVAATFATAKEAQTALDRLKADAPVVMNPPLPYILYDARRRGAGK